MNRDRRLFLVSVGEASHWENLLTKLEVACSSSAKARYRRFGSINEVFRITLADPDDRISVEIPKRNPKSVKNLRPMLLLVGLSMITFFEWRAYTLPAVYDAYRTLLHTCGVK